MGLETSNYKSTIRKHSTQFYLVEAIPKSYPPSPLLLRICNTTPLVLLVNLTLVFCRCKSLSQPSKTEDNHFSKFWELEGKLGFFEIFASKRENPL